MWQPQPEGNHAPVHSQQQQQQQQHGVQPSLQLQQQQQQHGVQPSLQLQQQQQQIRRVPYTACPLCKSGQIVQGVSAACTQHPLYQPALPPVQVWLTCRTCGHSFTNGYFDDAALALIFTTSNPSQVMNPAAVEQARAMSAPIVERVTEARRQAAAGWAGQAGQGAGTPAQQPTVTLQGEGERWLDVGCGNGSLFTTAAEFGYVAEGIDVRADAVATLQALGYTVSCGDFAKHAFEPGSFHVISMADVLEHMPWPRQALQQAHALLAPKGVLFVSLPNRDSLSWKVMDHTGTNPYYGELEHFHNFDRRGLSELLKAEGLQPVHYTISRRYKACMEIIAVKS